MKIHILTDVEGCAGVMNAADYAYQNSRYYELARELATLEVSAAVEGALEAGATQVLVADAHGPSGIDRQKLHPKALLLGGRPWPTELSTYGIDGSFAATMMIGHHARANTDGGHLCHTMSYGVEQYVLNGKPIGEIGLWSLVSGYFNVPLVMLSGDQAACDEAREYVPNIEAAAVKIGIKRGSASGLSKDENRLMNCAAIHMHPDEARALIRARAFSAVKRLPEFVPVRMDGPFKLEIYLRRDDQNKSPRKMVMSAGDFLDLVRPPVGQGKPKAAKPSKSSSKPKPKPAPRQPVKPKRKKSRK